MRISLRNTVLGSHLKSVSEVTASSYFITSLFAQSKTTSSSVQAGDTASRWRSGISDGLSFAGSCAATETKSWEFVAIWRCLGNALSSLDLNCYSLYLQEFQPEAGIL